MENEKKEVVDVKPAGIDKEVLDVMKHEDILEAISDDKQVKRLILNCFCEFLSEIKDLRKEFDNFMQTISVCSADKLMGFFKEVQKNVVDEENRIELQEKIKESHKKPKKSTKNAKKEENIVQFPEKSVK